MRIKRTNQPDRENISQMFLCQLFFSLVQSFTTYPLFSCFTTRRLEILKNVKSINSLYVRLLYAMNRKKRTISCTIDPPFYNLMLFKSLINWSFANTAKWLEIGVKVINNNLAENTFLKCLAEILFIDEEKVRQRTP